MGYIYELGGIKTGKILSTIGLKQGCPLSPVLFLIYLRPLEELLKASKLGCRLQRTVPGLFFADDIVLFEETGEGLEKMLEVVSEFGRKSKLEFSREKSKFMIMSGGREQREKLKMGNMELDRTEEYVYLGITLGTGENYLKEQEKRTMKKLGMYAGLIKNKSFYSYNRYEVSRILWKGVAVPGLTYGNNVIVLGAEIEEQLERTQNRMGRFALGVNRWTADEGVQGELGWSTFKTREAQAKMQFFIRLNGMEKDRYAKQVYNYTRLRMKPIEATKWFKRTRALERRYVGGGEYRMGGLGKVQEGWEDVCRKRIKETAHREWTEGMNRKTSLKESYVRKKAYERVSYMENGRGSSLLAQARTGSLYTNRKRSKYLPVRDECELCGERGDTTEHIVLTCSELTGYREGWEWPEEGWMDNDKLGYRLGFDIGGWALGGKELIQTKMLLSSWETKVQDRRH
jgi:hypothetical protein